MTDYYVPLTIVSFLLFLGVGFALLHKKCEEIHETLKDIHGALSRRE